MDISMSMAGSEIASAARCWFKDGMIFSLFEAAELEREHEDTLEVDVGMVKNFI
jgi:hypothetical protein